MLIHSIVHHSTDSSSGAEGSRAYSIVTPDSPVLNKKTETLRVSFDEVFSFINRYLYIVHVYKPATHYHY